MGPQSTLPDFLSCHSLLPFLQFLGCLRGIYGSLLCQGVFSSPQRLLFELRLILHVLIHIFLWGDLPLASWSARGPQLNAVNLSVLFLHNSCHSL